MEQFIDRESEMETLQNEYNRNGSSLVIMYGRRRETDKVRQRYRHEN